MPSQADLALQALSTSTPVAPQGTQADQALSLLTPNAAPKQQPTDITDRLENLLYGAAMGAGDLVEGIPQAMLHGINSAYDATVTPTSPKGPAGNYLQSLSDQFDQHLKNKENQYQTDTAGSGAAGLGRLGANVLPFLIGGNGANQAAKTPSLAQSLLDYGKTAVQGLGFGAVQPVLNVNKTPDGSSDFWDTKKLQSEIGAGGAVTGKFIGNRLASLLNPDVDPAIKNLIAQGVTPTPGQILGGGFADTENKLTSLPFSGSKIANAQNDSTISFNNAALNRGAVPGQPFSTKIGQEGIADAQNNYFGPKYDQILGQMTHAPDPQFAQDILNSASNNRLPSAGRDEITNFIQQKYLPLLNNGTQGAGMNGADVKAFQTQLRQAGNAYSSSQDPIDQRIGQTYSDMQGAFKNSLARQNAPDLVNQLNDLDRQYANFSTYKNASLRAGAANREGNITPSDYIGSILSNAKKTGDLNSFAGGDAYNQQFANDAKAVIGNKYPDSGTAGRAAMGGIIPMAAGALAYPATSLAYSDSGQKLLSALLTKRPSIAPEIANYVQQASPVIGAGLSQGLAQNLAQLLKNNSANGP